jgi:hypothetical protein
MIQRYPQSQLVAIVSLIVTANFLTPAALSQTPNQALSQTNRLTADEQAEGWLLLFDGETLFGWQPAGRADWSVSDGTIKVSDGEVCLLRTTTQFADYVLRADFRAAAGTNSGIFLRTPPLPSDPARDCYELNIAPPDNPFPTGSFVQRRRVDDASTEADQWHTYEVRAEAGRFEVLLDGELVLDYTDPAPLGFGYIGLQHNQGAVEFRNIKLKPLGLQSLFNGRDLSGWTTYPNMASRFTVSDAGEINVRNGRGQLESERSYDDFVLQLDCISHGEQLNSGVFFRCLPGQEMMGYECQIHNGFEGNDRRRPVDCGTGGIFRRVDARRVVADDFAWFRLTLIAQGPHISTWVNGYPVVDWTDTRRPDENPRRGRRTAAGTLMLQGHDPTTNLSFRRLEIVEYPARWPAATNESNTGTTAP